MCVVTLDTPLLVYQLRPLILHASPPSAQPAQALAREAAPVDEIRDVVLLFGAGLQLFTSDLSYVFAALHAWRGRG